MFDMAPQAIEIAENGLAKIRPVKVGAISCPRRPTVQG